MQQISSRFKKERWLIKKEVKSLLRSRWLILGFVISPMFAWLFQGAFISFVYDQSSGSGATSKVFFTLEDEGAMGESLFRNISENQFNLNITKIINITRDEGQALIDNRTLTVWVVVPSGFTESYTNYTGDHPIGIVQMYINRSFINAQIDYRPWIREVRIQEFTISPEATYGHQLAIFLIMITSVLAPAPYVSQSFAGEREKHTLEALLVVPISRIKILVAKLISGLLLTSIYMFFTVVGVLVYNWSILVRAPNPVEAAVFTVNVSTLPLLIFCQFLILLCSIGIGVVISCLAKDQATAESINSLTLLVPTMVIGILGFTGSINQFQGDLFGLFVQAIPFTHAVIILEGILTGSVSALSLLGNISYLLGFTLVFLIIGARLFDREAIIS
jgi:ABC-type Na+ efflux pump permease subunit